MPKGRLWFLLFAPDLQSNFFFFFFSCVHAAPLEFLSAILPVKQEAVVTL